MGSLGSVNGKGLSMVTVNMRLPAQDLMSYYLNNDILVFKSVIQISDIKYQISFILILPALNLYNELPGIDWPSVDCA